MDSRHYIKRCHELAILGGQKTSPNPKVGALLVDNEEIIGEGWHMQSGQAHAEINALKSVSAENRHRIENATMYVSLEPCSIYGSTPPCTAAIIREKIKKVVISARDKTAGVNNVSEHVLTKENVQLDYGIGHELGDRIAMPRNTFTDQKRPYIILKWAQSADNFIAKLNKPVAISNAFTNRYVHKLRSQVDSILIGSNTVKVDNPSLNTRMFPGPNPLRIILGNNFGDYDMYNITSDGNPTLVFGSNELANDSINNTFIPFASEGNTLSQVCDVLYQREIMTLLVEGGRRTLQSFIDQGLWDECRIITNPMKLNNGVFSPRFEGKVANQSFNILDDQINIFYNKKKH